MYISPKMATFAAVSEGYHCDGAGCVANCESNAVTVIEHPSTR